MPSSSFCNATQPGIIAGPSFLLDRILAWADRVDRAGTGVGVVVVSVQLAFVDMGVGSGSGGAAFFTPGIHNVAIGFDVGVVGECHRVGGAVEVVEGGSALSLLADHLSIHRWNVGQCGAVLYRTANRSRTQRKAVSQPKRRYQHEGVSRMAGRVRAAATGRADAGQR
ncbi:hypothetical protein KOR42_36120 [Thalassoglobus neptunius]|uniref:Uncharacterized protein n=1 Tax=Thalassoglobus neptunius TaxID=1938619 RepID=A0A5C5WH08_9PLAN|nr:hypothetical protein KOR42_36120 [Thalassoglobus neptunius]